MRIAVTSALSWPYIRRGNRCGYDLGRWLAGRGHDVTFITPAPGPRRHGIEADGMRVERVPLADSPLLTAAKIQRLASFAWRCARVLDGGGYDIVQATYPVDAWAASRHRARGGAPYVYMIIDCNPFHPPMRLGRTMFRSGIRRASGIAVISDYVGRRLLEDYGREALSIPLAADLEGFHPSGPKGAGPPVILCTASLSDPRKRVELLVRGFALLLDRVPEATLVLSGHSDPGTQAAFAAAAGARALGRIRFAGLGRREDLPDLYRSATISVLPSVNEAFGLVVVESLAAGTPVVATRSGALPEILDDERAGVLFPEDGGPEEVCRALLRGIEVAKAPDAPKICRRHVEGRFDWDAVGARYEALYEEILEREPRRSGAGFRAAAASPRAQAEAPPASRFQQFLDEADLTGEEYFDALRAAPGYEAVAAAWLARGRTGGRIGVDAPCWPLLPGLLSALGALPAAGGDGLDGWICAPASGSGPEPEILRRVRAGGCLIVLLEKARAGGWNPGPGWRLLARRPVAARSRVARGWGSTPLKTLVQAAPLRLMDSVLPGFRSHLLLVFAREEAG